VPLVRGREKSRLPENILAEARKIVAAGYKEITLLGQNVNSYGKGLVKGITFAELLREVNAIPGDFRIKFMTSHPKDCTYELLNTMASCNKVARHLHLPFQSGSSRILALMRRKYNADMAMRAINLLRENIPHVCFTTDVIVGFPQETQEDFNETAEFVKNARFLMVHIFPYSPRKGTDAAKMKGQIDNTEKSNRLHLLENISRITTREILNDEIASSPIKRVLFETFDGEFAHGHTDNFLEVAVPSSKDLKSEIFTVKLTKSDGNICYGEIVDDNI
jgi:tRNA-2-methylthio-N6-dimethylallyladenosine synthase